MEAQQQQALLRAQCIDMIKENPHLLSLPGVELKKLGWSDQKVRDDVFQSHCGLRL